MTLAQAVDTAAGALTLRVLGAFLREDVVGLRTRTRHEERSDGTWLLLEDADRTLAVPVEPDGFQAELRARLPLVQASGCTLADIGAIHAELATWADPRDRDGFAAYAEECRQTLATVRLHEATSEATNGLLAARHGADLAGWTGLRHSLAFDALAARLDHPVYPTARGRAGLDEDDLRAFAPEFAPEFELRWLSVPREAVTLGSGAAFSFPSAADHLLLPVHPLTVGPALDAAVRGAGLEGVALLVDGPDLPVTPTLSMRTVARLDRPGEHIKVPLATATLGLRNRRTVKPGTLIDGVAGQQLVAAVLEQTPALRDRVLHADETHYAHAGHELLAALVRRYPAGLDDALVVPLAALLAPALDGRLVIEHVADLAGGGSLLSFLTDLWDLLLDLQVTLFTHGIALESHQQNLSVILSPGAPLGLLLKDNDGPRVLRARAAALGRLPAFDDPRTWVDDDGPLADMVATITLHLCAGSYAFGLAEAGIVDRDIVLAALRDCLERALDRPGAAYLRERLLEAPELPIKAMVTAGSLLSKERSGAADVNKHYSTGPNYLHSTPGMAR